MDWTRNLHVIMVRTTISRSGLSRNPRLTVSRVNGARIRHLMIGVTLLCLRASVAHEFVVASVVGGVKGAVPVICVNGVRMVRLEIGRISAKPSE